MASEGEVGVGDGWRERLQQEKEKILIETLNSKSSKKESRQTCPVTTYPL